MAAVSIEISAPAEETAGIRLPTSVAAGGMSRPHPGIVAATAAASVVLQKVRLCIAATPIIPAP
ncbi:MAG: hypothetical protein IH838_12315, partial [Proteobacteria bacterium]|nr:hypothetical protein [Pseudomonadota bacterium]